MTFNKWEKADASVRGLLPLLINILSYNINGRLVNCGDYVFLKEKTFKMTEMKEKTGKIRFLAWDYLNVFTRNLS